MDKNKLTHQSHYSISTRDADFNKDLRFSSLVNFFIQGAWKHAEELGFGYSHLSEIGIGWVLSRLKIRIEDLPSWPGDIKLTTWPKGMDRIMYIRDAEMHNMDEKKIASITSAWLVVDIKTKRLTRAFPASDYFTDIKTRSALDEQIPSLKYDGETSFSKNIRVSYNDIDMNMHLTTIRYIDFMFDTYDIDFVKDNIPDELTVNFLKEIPFGANLEMRRSEKSNLHSFELVNTDTGIVSFRGEISFKQK